MPATQPVAPLRLFLFSVEIFFPILYPYTRLDVVHEVRHECQSCLCGEKVVAPFWRNGCGLVFNEFSFTFFLCSLLYSNGGLTIDTCSNVVYDFLGIFRNGS